MSRKSVERIPCPGCHRVQDFPIWSSLNVTLNPEEKAHLMDGSLMKFTCKSCGHSAQVCYALLYHDMQQSLMIWLVPPSPNGKPGAVPDTGGMVFGENYRLRAVDSYDQLREKILIFDDSLDDRIIELAKLMARAHWEKTNPGRNAEIYYSGSSGEGEGAMMNFVILCESERTGVSVSRDKMYRLLSREFAARLEKPPAPWLRVDKSFALSLLQAGSATELAPSAPAPAKKRWWPFGRGTRP
jgi:hypothetical protein